MDEKWFHRICMLRRCAILAAALVEPACKFNRNTYYDGTPVVTTGSLLGIARQSHEHLKHGASSSRVAFQVLQSPPPQRHLHKDVQKRGKDSQHHYHHDCAYRDPHDVKKPDRIFYTYVLAPRILQMRRAQSPTNTFRNCVNEPMWIA